MRLNLVILVAVLLGLGAAVYRVADRVQTHERRIERLDRKIADESEAVRVLSAEWTVLTTPERLETLAVKHLKLEPMDGRQYIALGAVPMRELPTDEIAEETAELADITPTSGRSAAIMPDALSITRVSARGN
jgi:cell division protein FtsL